MRPINADALKARYGLDEAVQYGNKNAKQQAKSYCTLPMYEIAKLVDNMETLKIIPSELIDEIIADIENEVVSPPKEKYQVDINTGLRTAIHIIKKNMKAYNKKLEQQKGKINVI